MEKWKAVALANGNKNNQAHNMSNKNFIGFLLVDQRLINVKLCNITAAMPCMTLFNTLSFVFIILAKNKSLIKLANHYNGLCFLILEFILYKIFISFVCCSLEKLLTALQFFSGIWTIQNVMFSVSVTTRKKQNKAFP